MNPLDELFGKKLSAHKVQPSADAWSRIEKNIAKKNSGWIIWLRAASIVFLLGVGFVAWRIIDTQDANQPPQVATVTESTGKPEAETTDKGVLKVDNQEAGKPVHEIKAESQTTTKRNNPTKTTVEKKMIAQHQNPEDLKEVAKAVGDKYQTIAPAQERPLEVTPSATGLDKVTADKAMVVVYTLELPAQVEESMQGATASTELEKKTGLKRVLELARDARSTENPIGELRQAKNELLAFNFGRDREQRNDK